MPNKELLLRYADLKIQIDKATAEAEMLKPAVMLEISSIRGDSDSPVELSDLPGYSFSISKGKKKWTYSASTAALEKRLKELKLEEEQTGAATFEEGTPYVQLNRPKE